MKYFQSLTLCILLIVFLSACSPIYKTEYAYVPPESDVSKMCTANCIIQKTMCKQMCEMKIENCRLRERLEKDKKEQESENTPLIKTLNSLGNLFGCDESCNCDEAYNDCYTECGGKILERKVCVAFCDKK